MNTQSPYTVAVADYLNAPDIRDVDFSAFRGQIGDPIVIQATDDFAVLHVRIQNPDGSLVEEGNADPDGYTYRYAATVRNTSLTGDKIIVSVHNNSSNETTAQNTLYFGSPCPSAIPRPAPSPHKVYTYCTPRPNRVDAPALGKV